ncbi:MAG TPA: hypothetical protein VGK19_18230 [Capsulimonadaceae bacterium]|jgi:hypothetical protein
MTLIATQISKHGIVHAADSNVTVVTQQNGIATVRTDPTPGKKVYDLRPAINAALTVAGSYSVGGIDMPTWMGGFLGNQATIPSVTLEGFARALSSALEAQMTSVEKANGSIVHIAGYVEVGNESHAEFWFVRNVYGILATGEYDDIRDTFQVGEDFWSRDCPTDDTMENGAYQLYANGFHEGRMPFMGVARHLGQFFSDVWKYPTWNLRPPSSIDGYEKLIRLYMSTVTTLFDICESKAPAIGGNVETVGIPAPVNAIHRR